jgi:hypothetical protein
MWYTYLRWLVVEVLLADVRSVVATQFFTLLAIDTQGLYDQDTVSRDTPQVTATSVIPV